jgi:hypothetical protein
VLAALRVQTVKHRRHSALRATQVQPEATVRREAAAPVEAMLRGKVLAVGPAQPISSTRSMISAVAVAVLVVREEMRF